MPHPPKLWSTRYSRWLGAQTRHAIGHIAAGDVFGGAARIVQALEDQHRAGYRLIVVDAIRDTDLIAIGKAAKGLPLITGGSGVALGLPANIGCAPAPVPWQGQAGKAVVLSGSCSGATRAQVARHATHHPAREITATDVVAGRVSTSEIEAWLLGTQGLPLVYSSADPAAVGSTGNISARTEDGGLLVSPTGTSFGRLDLAGLSRLDARGILIDGDPPTKEMPLHSAFYDTRSTAGAVVHLHSCHSVAWSMMPDANEDDFLPPLTPYAIMKLGRVKLLPFFLPGDPAMGQAVRGLVGKRSAVMLASHGPVVAGKDLESGCSAIEELEETARLAMLLRVVKARGLSDAQVHAVVTTFNGEWDT